MGLTNSEAEEVVLFQKGDRKAFEQLYDQYAPMLFGVISRVVPDPQLAIQVFRQSFIYLWQHRSAYNPAIERIFTWMNKGALAIATRMANDLESVEKNPQSENQNRSFPVSIRNT